MESEIAAGESSNRQYIESLKTQLSSCKSEIQDLREIQSSSAQTNNNQDQLESLKEQYPYQFLLHRKQCEKELNQESLRLIEGQKSILTRELNDVHSRAIIELKKKYDVLRESYLESKTMESSGRIQELQVEFGHAKKLAAQVHSQEMAALVGKYEERAKEVNLYCERDVERLRIDNEELKRRIDADGDSSVRIGEVERAGKEKLDSLRQKYVETLEKIRIDVKEMRKVWRCMGLI